MALLVPALALAAEGDLDAGFGSGGTVITPIGTSTDEAHAMAIDSQGRIVTAGQSINGTALDDFALARYEENGSLDAGFGSAGEVTTGFGTKTDDLGRGVAIDSQGRIVAVGSSNDGLGGPSDFAVARFTSTGSPDGGFAGAGKVLTSVRSGDDAAAAVAIDSQDRVVVAGRSSNGLNDDIAVVRYRTDGTLDTSFGGTGKVTTPVGSGLDRANAVAIDSQGRIVVAGPTFNGTKDNFAVVRYRADGGLDTTFTGTGKVTTSISASGFDRANAVAIDAQGRIVVAGQTFNGADDDFALVRYNPNGTLDTTFNGTGKVTTAIGNGDDEANSVAIDQQGRIVAGGAVFNPNADFGVARYNADGALDTSFNGVGKVTTSLTAGNDRIRGLAIDQRDRVVAAGDTGNDFALARYIGDEVPPKVTFGGGGPPPGSFTNDPTPTFTFSSSESGSTFACGIDAIPPTPCSSPFTVGTSLADGAHSVSIVAIDRAGNASAALRRTFKVDTRKPTLKIKGDRRIDARRGEGIAKLKLKANEPVTLRCKVDREKPESCDARFRVRLEIGRHKLRVTATDRAGNRSSKKKRLVVA